MMPLSAITPPTPMITATPGDAEELDGREEAGRDLDRLEVGVELRLVRRVEPLEVRVLLAVRLDDAHAREALPAAWRGCARSGRARRGTPCSTRGGTSARRSSSGIEEHDHAQCELPRQQEDPRQRAEEEQDVLGEPEDADLDELLERVDVRGHARHEHAGLLTLEEVEPERHHVVEHPLAEVLEERLADPRQLPHRVARRARARAARARGT